MLQRLLEAIDLPDASSKQKNKLIKKLSRVSDKESDALADEVQSLLSARSSGSLQKTRHR